MENIKQDLTLLVGSDKLIVQQTNCVHVWAESGKGLAQSLHLKWPHCHPYDRNGVQPEMGSIQIIASVDNSPSICCLNAQRNVGRKQIKDDYEERLVAFETALDKMAQHLKWGELINIKTVYFPYKIGCGYGHGDWARYQKVLTQFVGKITQPCYTCEAPSKKE